MGFFGAVKSVCSRVKKLASNSLKSIGKGFKSKRKDNKTVKDGCGASGALKEGFVDEDEACLSRQDFDDSDDLDDLGEEYRCRGVDVGSVSDVYAEAQKDWRTLHNDLELDRNDGLAHDAYSVGLGDCSVELNVSGISHGQKYFYQVSDDVADYLKDEIDEIVTQGGRVYLEDGFDETVFDHYFDDYRGVEELDDRKLIGIEGEEKSSIMEEIIGKYFEGPLIGFVQKVSRCFNKDKGEDYLKETSIEALEDPSKIPELQECVKAYTLPRKFREDYFDRKMGEIAEKEQYLESERDRLENCEPNGLLENLENKFYQAVLNIGERKVNSEKQYQGFKEVAGWQRSKYMVNEALKRAEEKGENKIWLIVGAHHQADIHQYLENIDLESVSTEVEAQDFYEKY